MICVLRNVTVVRGCFLLYFFFFFFYIYAYFINMISQFTNVCMVAAISVHHVVTADGSIFLSSDKSHFNDELKEKVKGRNM